MSGYAHFGYNVAFLRCCCFVVVDVGFGLLFCFLFCFSLFFLWMFGGVGLLFVFFRLMFLLLLFLLSYYYY